jgi:hypothetical protein
MKQTDSTISSVRGWGCYLLCLAWLAGVRDIAVVDRLFSRLVKRGYIIDNQFPTTSKGWYRCYVVQPEKIVKAFANELGKKILAEELSRHPHNPEPMRGGMGIHIIKEAVTENGYHFGVIWPSRFNPDPRFSLDGEGRSYRLWSIA